MGADTFPQGILILVLDLSLRIPRKFGKPSRGESWSDFTATMAADLMFVLDAAIEYPLFFAFHPVTLSSAGTDISGKLFPQTTQLALQLATLISVEYAFGHAVLSRVSFSAGDTAPSAADPNKSAQSQLSDGSSDDGAANLAVEFLKPRGALLLAMAIPACSSPFSSYCGSFHPLSIALWAALRQLWVKPDGVVGSEYWHYF
jgi:hypothetical protein